MLLKRRTRKKMTHIRKLKEVKQKLEPYGRLSSLERRGRLANEVLYANLLRGKREHEIEEARHDEACFRIKQRMERFAYVADEAKCDETTSVTPPLMPSSI